MGKRVVKKEVRILGLGATAVIKNRTVVIGVVFRGNLWLDGMVATSLDLKKQDHISIVSRLITRSKQYSQLRAVILSKQLFPNEKIRITDLARSIKLPVIRIIGKTRGSATYSRDMSNGNRYDLVVDGKHVSVLATGLSPQGAKEIFSIACATNRKIPEAVRVAGLIAKHVRTGVLTEIGQSQEL